MTPDEYEQEAWLERHVEVPPVLQPAVRVFGRARLFALLEGLAEELGLRTEQASPSTWRLVDAMREPVRVALETGRVVLDDRLPKIARAAAESLNLGDAARAMVELGWGKARVRDVQVIQLADAVQDLLAERLTNQIQRMFLRWESAACWVETHLEFRGDVRGTGKVLREPPSPRIRPPLAWRPPATARRASPGSPRPRTWPRLRLSQRPTRERLTRRTFRLDGPLVFATPGVAVRLGPELERIRRQAIGRGESLHDDVATYIDDMVSLGRTERQHNMTELAQPTSVSGSAEAEVAELESTMGFMGTSDVAQVLGRTTRNVRDLRQRGKLRGTQLGRGWAFDPVDVAELLRKRQERP